MQVWQFSMIFYVWLSFCQIIKYWKNAEDEKLKTQVWEDKAEAQSLNPRLNVTDCLFEHFHCKSQTWSRWRIEAERKLWE